MLKRWRQIFVAEADTERFPLDRLCLDEDAPLRCEVERVGAALEQVATCFNA